MLAKFHHNRFLLIGLIALALVAANFLSKVAEAGTVHTVQAIAHDMVGSPGDRKHHVIVFEVGTDIKVNPDGTLDTLAYVYSTKFPNWFKWWGIWIQGWDVPPTFWDYKDGRIGLYIQTRWWDHFRDDYSEQEIVDSFYLRYVE